MKEKIIGIYKIINLITGDTYIGSSKDVYNRWKRHRYDLNHNKHHSKYLQNAWNKYGAENFKFDVIEQCSLEKEILLEIEQKYLDLLKPNYNTCHIAGSPFTIAVSEETKRKKSEALKGKTWEELYGIEGAQKRREKLKEKSTKKTIKHKKGSIEYSVQMSKSMSGNQNRLGAFHTDESKSKISQKMTGRKMSDETKEKIRQTLKNKYK